MQLRDGRSGDAMSLALYTYGGLRFWGSREIAFRDHCVDRLAAMIRDSLLAINPAWRFERVEGPVITPAQKLSGDYTRSDVWMLMDPLGGDVPGCLRAETTPSSYEYARYLL